MFIIVYGSNTKSVPIVKERKIDAFRLPSKNRFIFKVDKDLKSFRNLSFLKNYFWHSKLRIKHLELVDIKYNDNRGKAPYTITVYDHNAKDTNKFYSANILPEECLNEVIEILMKASQFQTMKEYLKNKK